MAWAKWIIRYISKNRKERKIFIGWATRRECSSRRRKEAAYGRCRVERRVDFAHRDAGGILGVDVMGVPSTERPFGAASFAF